MYLGLVGENGKEISVPGYQRVYLGDSSLAISAGRLHNHLTFINTTPIWFSNVFPPKWKKLIACGVAAFVEVDSKLPVSVTRFIDDKHLKLLYGDSVAIGPGGLIFDIKLTEKQWHDISEPPLHQPARGTGGSTLPVDGRKRKSVSLARRGKNKDRSANPKSVRT